MVHIIHHLMMYLDNFVVFFLPYFMENRKHWQKPCRYSLLCDGLFLYFSLKVFFNLSI